MRLFWDTNILLDLVMQNRPQRAEAGQTFARCMNNELNILISPLSLATAHYVLEKKIGHDNAVLALSRVMQHATPTKISTNVSMLAIANANHDFEDAIQYYIALENDADCIITRDLKGFENRLIKYMDSITFLNK